MTEKLLQFIWRLQYYHKSELVTTGSQQLQVFNPGFLNTNQGPDFYHARIAIGDVLWAGSVELHLCTSDWNRHRHTGDRHYDNVVLHVVWQHDREVNETPVLELCSRVPKLMLDRYRQLMEATSFIPCASQMKKVPDLTWRSWKERLVAERLQRRSSEIIEKLEASKGHWEELCWWQMAKAFGGKINGDSFERIAQSIPVTILAKCKNELLQVEALLLGQAGLLDSIQKEQDGYVSALKKEYDYLQHKFSLRKIQAPLFYFRMRPPGFPDIRLAQLAALISRSSHLFSKIKEEDKLPVVKDWLLAAASSYWHQHYRLGVLSATVAARPGHDFTDHIIINTVCPLLFAYGQYHQLTTYKEKAISWLTAITAENNKVIRGFSDAGVHVQQAMDSQALLELKSQYCEPKRCLDCTIGATLLKHNEVA